ncbi:hypothetical protein PHET_05066 [Paragonimus heterotremus]|uniref:EF-hand domain-containing protein n=1 Tax=Paragonimus heterotremus TaxID=100268 RepID=A0A8J4TB29_9TREM|nr:hypothetical protein PHET_05066 [Paragonimus heterotremus]
MVDTIPKEELEKLRRAFSVYDKNGDGEIDTFELTSVLRMLGKNPSPAEVAEIMKRVDKDRSGTINFPEFLAMMLQKKKYCQLDADLRTSFQYYDKNKDGYICIEELRSVLGKHPGPLSQVDINMLIQEVDRDGDGRLNYEEFLTLMRDWLP